MIPSQMIQAIINRRNALIPCLRAARSHRQQDGDGSGGEDKGDEEAEDSIAALEVLEAADESDPIYLLYPPLGLRTPRQKRTQIVLLGEVVLEVQRAFNKHLDRLHSAKDDCMDKVTGEKYGAAAAAWGSITHGSSGPVEPTVLVD